LLLEGFRKDEVRSIKDHRGDFSRFGFERSVVTWLEFLSIPKPPYCLLNNIRQLAFPSIGRKSSGVVTDMGLDVMLVKSFFSEGEDCLCARALCKLINGTQFEQRFD
jgi:hypothetical protein